MPETDFVMQLTAKTGTSSSTQAKAMVAVEEAQLQQQKDDPLEPMKSYVAAIKTFTVFVILLFALNALGSFDYLVEYDYSSHFRYPYEVDVLRQLELIRQGRRPELKPLSMQEWIIANEPQSCQDSEHSLMILIKSKLTNFELRNRIRKTWGRNRDLQTPQAPGSNNATMRIRVRHKFLIGLFVTAGVPHQSIDVAQLIDESSVFGDILLQPIADDDQTSKLLMQLQWSASVCNNSRFLLAFDDKYYLSLANLASLLDDYAADYGSSSKDLLLGAASLSRPSRLKASRNYVSLKEYPFSAYPPKLNTDAFLMSQQTASKLFVAAQFTKRFMFSDVYLGILCKKLNIVPKYYQNFIRRSAASMNNSIAICTEQQ